ncbi:MAG: hypothetical protein EMLJLAPB_00136 [Candidatus Argoarchaeum ethanivorans]|uniref:DUF63 domain-containing protein n=1 Tax=Candidatus Argoarchaeum ethanivorans TaxID=2608793 RepID=A0A811TA00_9EURY|nr:MAG: hypothetical protein EMLJLAPB_00136 [Candidatus Argoarchaeum ethanivorans]
MLDSIKQFIYTYYLSGIINDTPYNIVDTITYAIILGISIFAVLKLLSCLNVDVDRKFILAIVPYILAGSALRVIKDTGLVQAPWKYMLVTPPIYFVVFAVTVLLLVLSIKIASKTRNDYYVIFAILGVIWFAVNLTILVTIKTPERLDIPPLIIILGIAATTIVYQIAKKINFHYLTDKLNISILAAHLLDASSTFVGIDMLGYYEKHVVPTWLINQIGTAAVMYPLKLGIFIPVIYLLDTEFKEEKYHTLKNLIKLVILVLGLSPAVRNTLRMTLLV